MISKNELCVGCCGLVIILCAIIGVIHNNFTDTNDTESINNTTDINTMFKPPQTVIVPAQEMLFVNVAYNKSSGNYDIPEFFDKDHEQYTIRGMVNGTKFDFHDNDVSRDLFYIFPDELNDDRRPITNVWNAYEIKLEYQKDGYYTIKEV